MGGFRLKKKLRKSVTVLAASALVFTAACSSDNSSNGGQASAPASGAASGSGESQEVVTLKVFISTANVPTNIIDNPQMKEIEKRIGVKLDFSPYTGGGDAKQKLGTLIAANELPDLIYNDDAETNNLLLKNDLILPLDELIKTRGQELDKNIKQGLDYSRAMFSNDTKQIYFVPNIVGDENVYPSGYDLVFQLRGDLLKKSGLSDPKSFDELLQYGFGAAGAAACQVMAIHGLGQDPVAISIETAHQFVALVVDITAGLKIVGFIDIGIGLLLVHQRGIAIGKHAYGPGSFKSCGTRLVVGLAKSLVGCKGQPLRRMDSNAPGAFRSRSYQQEQVTDLLRLGQRPFHGLVATHTAACKQVDLFDTQVPAQQDMRLYHIAYG